MVILVLEKIWNGLSTLWTSIASLKILANATYTKSMPARKQTWLNHNVQAYWAIYFHLFLLCLVMISQNSFNVAFLYGKFFHKECLFLFFTYLRDWLHFKFPLFVLSSLKITFAFNLELRLFIKVHDFELNPISIFDSFLSPWFHDIGLHHILILFPFMLIADFLFSIYNLAISAFLYIFVLQFLIFFSLLRCLIVKELDSFWFIYICLNSILLSDQFTHVFVVYHPFHYHFLENFAYSPNLLKVFYPKHSSFGWFSIHMNIFCVFKISKVIVPIDFY